MDDSEQKLKLQFGTAQDHFKKSEYAQCRKLLGDIKTTHLSIELNSLLCEYKENPHKIASVLKKIMDILIAVNIKIYQQMPKNQINGKKSQKTPKISHQFYYWNIIVLAQLLPNPEIAQLISNEALHFTDSLRTETSLMILYQMLSTMQSANRLASCISLIERQNRLIIRVKRLTTLEEAYRFLNQVLFCKVLLKIGMIEESRIMYMMKFNQNIGQGNEDLQVIQINSIHIKFYQQFLHAEIEYHAKNYGQSLKILADIIPQVENCNKREFLRQIVDHNIALILLNFKNFSPAQIFITKTLTFLTTNQKQLQKNTQKFGLITKCKQNLLLSMLASGKNYEQGFQLIKQTQHSQSFKINYRKAQLCLSYYHKLLQNPQKVAAYKDIHDFYQTVYYYPNLPYFQQKGKNKNPNYTNAKFFYRRYVLTPWQHEFKTRDQYVSVLQGMKEANQKIDKDFSNQKESSKQQQKQKGISKNKKGRKDEEIKEDPREEIIIKKDQSFEGHLKQILIMAESFLKDALIILEKQKQIVVSFEEQQKGYTNQVNEKLYNEYVTYKSNILSQLCYLYLCKREWIKTVRYAEQYQLFQKQYQLNPKSPVQQKIHYNILTYKTEAYCQLSRIDKAYEALQDLINGVDYAQTTTLDSRSTSSHLKGQTYFEKSSQYNNFSYNLSVLHSRDNKVAETYNTIQKLLQQMRVIPSNPTANLPLSVIDLLIHYNMRTGNNQSALQMIKRRRILNLPGVIGHYQPMLSVTK